MTALDDIDWAAVDGHRIGGPVYVQLCVAGRCR
jgi:hypothetical protein